MSKGSKGLAGREGKLAADDRGGEFAGEAVVKKAEAANGDGLEEVEDEGALFDEFLESGDGHLVEAAFDFGEARGSVAANVRAPANEGFFREEQVGPGKDGE